MSQISIAENIFKTTWSRLDLSSIRMPLLLSFLNQFVGSGGNFLVGIYLARTLPLEGFGLYGIGFGICMLYVGVGNAVILTQMVVNMADKPAEEKESYAARMLLAVLMLGCAVLATTIVAGLIVAMISPHGSALLMPVLAIVVASVLFLCNEFFVSYAYLKRKEGMALTVNASMMLVLFSGLAIEKVSGIVPSAEHVLLLYALGAAIGSGIAYLASPLSLWRNLRNLMPDYIESWRHGRWALGGVIVTWIQSQAYTYVVAVFLGPAGVGLANAARIFISPVTFLLPAINKVAIPRLADLRQSNPGKMPTVSKLVTAAMTALALLYSLALLAGLDFVIPLVLGRQDPRIASLVWIWCLVLVLQMIRSGGSVLMQVQRKFRILTLINIPSAAVTIAAAVILIQAYGVAGAIGGMLIGEIVLSALIWKEIQHDGISASGERN